MVVLTDKENRLLRSFLVSHPWRMFATVIGSILAVVVIVLGIYMLRQRVYSSEAFYFGWIALVVGMMFTLKGVNDVHNHYRIKTLARIANKLMGSIDKPESKPEEPKPEGPKPEGTV